MASDFVTLTPLFLPSLKARSLLFAHLFRDGLGSDNALFLDGSISSLFAPALGRSDTLYPMGQSLRRSRESDGLACQVKRILKKF